LVIDKNYAEMHDHRNVKLRLNLMVTPCINNIQHFIFQVMHTVLKNIVIKTF